MILSGPALQVRQELFPWLRRLAGVGSVLFPRLRLVRMGGRNISRDPAIVAQFRDDPLVFHGRFPVRTGAEILRAGGLARAQFEQVRTPLLILHGTADRVAAVDASQALLQRAETADKTLHLYPELYHEVFNEPEKSQVLADMIAWIDQRAVRIGRRVPSANRGRRGGSCRPIPGYSRRVGRGRASRWWVIANGNC